MPGTPKYSDEELLEEIRRVNEAVRPTPPRKSDMEEVGNIAPRTIQLRFGSWNEAVRRAGFTPRGGIEAMERPPECPLCGFDERALDFHHWNYGDDPFGCYLCRDCHDIVHAGNGDRRNEDWLTHSVFNLVEEHTRQGHPPEVAKILSRYNLARLEPLVEVAVERMRLDG
jgi:hypothetical protein